MTKPIKQHYIPQFLLREFATGKKDKARLWTFDKRTGKTFNGSVRDAAHENLFYEAVNLDGEKLEGEGLLAMVDGWGASALKAVVRDEYLPHEGKAVTDISYFVAAQMFRVPAVRNEMEFFRTSVIKKWGPDVRAGQDSRPISAYGPADAKYSSLTSLRDVPDFAKLLQSKIWFLLKAPLGTAFILSDNPVIRHNHIDYWPRGSLGLNQKGIEVNFPITPRLCLQFLCPEIANQLRFSRVGQIYIQAQNAGYPVMLEPENVEFINSKEVLFSERFIFARSEQDFALAKDMLRENPRLAEPASTRTIAE